MSEDRSIEPRSGARLRFLESILGNANDAVIITEADPMEDPGPRIVYVNEAFTRMTGYAPAEILGENPRILQGADTERAKLDEIRTALLKKEPIRTELINYHKDGTGFWVELDIVPMFGNGGWPEYWLSVQRETTERVRAEEARRESERRLRSILAQYGTDMITILDPDGTPVYESPQIEVNLGYPHGELTEGDLYRYVHPDDVERLAGAVAASLRTPGSSSPVEYRIRHADGSWRYFESVGTNLAHDPEVGAVVVNTRDITERRRAEETLKQSEAKFRAVFDRAATGMALVDAEGRLMQTNQALREMLGYSEEELRGMHFSEVTHPEDVEKDRGLFEELMKGKRDHFRLEKRYLCKDGDVVWGRLTSSVIREESGETRFMVGMVEDVTERRRAEEDLARERNLLRTVIDSAHDGIFVKDREHRFILNNRTHQEIHGAKNQEELLGKTNTDLWGEERATPQHSDDRRVMETGEPLVDREEIIHLHSGEQLWWSTTKVPLRDSEGEVEGVVVVGRDITQRKQAEQALKESEELLRAVTSGAPVILFALDREGTITLSEGKGLASVGERPGEIVGRSIFEYCEGQPEIIQNVRRALGGEDVAATLEMGGLAFEARYSPTRDSEGGVTGVIGVATDVTERRELEKELEHRAFHDPLTDLPNRALFMDRLSHALEHRGGSVAVLFMDLDGFKAVNDRFGHERGDSLLVAVAGRLRECLRPADTVSRFGGDEFVVLLENATHEESGEVASRISEALRVPFALDEAGNEALLTVSVGIAHGSPTQQNPAELLKAADRAMYEAKVSGKDGFRYYRR